MNTEELLAQASVIPVLEVVSLSDAAPLARALADGGLRVVELTLRTDCALEAVAEMKSAAPELIVGMGTLRQAEDAEKSAKAGAEFLVTPGATASLLKALADTGLPTLPGVATASEAMTAMEYGFNAQKFFPAELSGGVAWVKSIKGPLADIMWCPSGGIAEDKVAEYMALDNVACVGGSWIASRSAISGKDWAGITENARRAAAFNT
ncbi:MAG: keto-deoxy-phosphogluconate aldolase [Hirschia sp.]|nr:keto-deoxy-phosphogluconate aldolase [Hirschia sp.]MBF19040.1 keto-deoxy-phosphogluconate aldolase [Hirschia sp.]